MGYSAEFGGFASNSVPLDVDLLSDIGGGI